MDFRVRVTSDAEKQFNETLNYLVFNKHSSQAARRFVEEFEELISTLSTAAGSFKLCDNFRLRSLGYRRLNFPSMNYFLLYRIVDNKVLIDAIFHSLQDYENKMR